MRICRRLLVFMLVVSLLALCLPAAIAVDYTDENYLSTAWDISVGVLDGVTGATCGIKGTVSYVNDREVFVQDATGGICARFSAAPSAEPGQTLTVVGQAAADNGLPILQNARIVLTAPGTQAAAVPATIEKLMSYPRLYLNRLVRLEAVTVSGSSADGAPILTDGSRQLACSGLQSALPAGTVVDAQMVFTREGAAYTLMGSTESLTAKQYTITVRRMGNGTISPGTCTLPAGSTQRFTITPDADQRLEAVWINGVEQGRVSEYTLENLRQDTTIYAVFCGKYETPIDMSIDVTASCTEGGSVSPVQKTLYLAENHTVSVTPAAGWHIGSLLIDGAPVPPTQSYSFYSLDSNHALRAEFARCNYITDSVTPTCLEPGGSLRFCTLCGDIIVDETIPMTGHTPVFDAQLLPTCTEAGHTSGYHCAVCGEVITQPTPLPPLGHTEVKDLAIPATCTENGKTLGSHCSVCGEVLVAQTQTTALGHDFRWVTDKVATETEPGEKHEQCSRCDATRNEHTEIPATGTAHEHSYTELVTQPTCTEAGYTTYTCACGDSRREETTAALGHAFDQKTGENYFYTYFQCSRCGETITEENKPLPFAESPSKQYPDISDTWYRSAADYVISTDLMRSTKAEENSFEPNTDMTRAMLVSVLYRLEGSKQAEHPKKQFTDVPKESWYTDAVLWAAENGIVSGTGDGTTFSPNAKISREQIAVILYNYCKNFKKLDVSKTAALDSFSDAAQVSTWAQNALCWAVAEKLISGRISDGSTLLAPQGSAMRCEVASILCGLAKNLLVPAAHAGS